MNHHRHIGRRLIAPQTIQDAPWPTLPIIGIAGHARAGKDTIALIIQQEMTRALIINPKWYLMLNYWSLMDYDAKSMSDIMLAGADRGYVCGDEWRDKMHLPPAGLKEFKVLENYIPYDKSGDQKKLVGNT